MVFTKVFFIEVKRLEIKLLRFVKLPGHFIQQGKVVQLNGIVGMVLPFKIPANGLAEP
jgi:hypothetical protein